MNFVRYAGLGSSLLISMLVACTPQADNYEPGSVAVTQGASQALSTFDFENGNIASEVVIPTVVPTVTQNISASDASLVLYTTSTTVTSWFDAIAPYSTKMVGVFSRIPRRPAAEGANNRNRNIAILYASLRTLSATASPPGRRRSASTPCGPSRRSAISTGRGSCGRGVVRARER